MTSTRESCRDGCCGSGEERNATHTAFVLSPSTLLRTSSEQRSRNTQ
jgi:hypothetical protein